MCQRNTLTLTLTDTTRIFRINPYKGEQQWCNTGRRDGAPPDTTRIFYRNPYQGEEQWYRGFRIWMECGAKVIGGEMEPHLTPPEIFIETLIKVKNSCVEVGGCGWIVVYRCLTKRWSVI